MPKLVQDLVAAALSRDPQEFVRGFEDVLQDRLHDIVSDYKVEVAQTMFEGPKDPDEDEVEDDSGVAHDGAGEGDEEDLGDVEQVDEISKGLLVNYMDKSTKQSKVLRKKYSAGKASDSELKQLDRRDHGQINALNKFHGYSKVKPSGKDRAFDMAQKLSAAKKKGK